MALVIGALLLSLALPVLGSGAVAEVAPASAAEVLDGLPLKSLDGSNVSNAAVLLPEGAPENPSVDKWAVVIGIADYEGTEYDLWHPDEDGREMARALVKDYGFPRGNIIQLYNEKATAAAILAAIDWLDSKEGPRSTVVFFYSGHGFRVPDDYFIGSDTDKERDGFDEGIGSYDLYAIPDGLLAEEFGTFASREFALIFGSCNSGGMFDDNDDLQGRGRVIVAACKADQLSWDYLRLGNTLFGYYFVDKAILDGKAETDRPADGVSMEEAFRYAYPRVTAKEPDSQPQIYDNFRGELIP
jgi:uncharacterized caspase-like protein